MIFDRVLLRTIIPLTFQRLDPRPHIRPEMINFRFQNTSIYSHGENILIDTGAKYCTLDNRTAALLTGNDAEELEDYLRYLYEQPHYSIQSLLPFGAPFGKPKYITAVAGLGFWSLYIDRVEIFVGKKYIGMFRAFTAQNLRTILGMPFLEQVKLVLDRKKERSIVLF